MILYILFSFAFFMRLEFAAGANDHEEERGGRGDGDVWRRLMYGKCDVTEDDEDYLDSRAAKT